MEISLQTADLRRGEPDILDHEEQQDVNNSLLLFGLELRISESKGESVKEFHGVEVNEGPQIRICRFGFGVRRAVEGGYAEQDLLPDQVGLVLGNFPERISVARKAAAYVDQYFVSQFVLVASRLLVCIPVIAQSIQEFDQRRDVVAHALVVNVEHCVVQAVRPAQGNDLEMDFIFHESSENCWTYSLEKIKNENR